MLSSRVLLAGTGYGGGDGGSGALVVAEFHADGGVVRNRYDVFGDLRDAADALGRHTLNGYDALGRLVQAAHPAGAAGALTDSYGYDLLGRRISHSDTVHGSGDVETTDYDVQGRVTRTRAFGGDVTTTGYAWNGGLATAGLGAFGGYDRTITYADGRTAKESSDAFGHVVSHADLGGHVTAMSYDSAGRLIERAGSGSDADQRYGYLNTGLAAGVTLAGCLPDVELMQELTVALARPARSTAPVKAA